MECKDITIECVQCGGKFIIKVPVEGMRRWASGSFIQDALPTLSEDERELLISNICPTCFEELVKEEEL